MNFGKLAKVAVIVTVLMINTVSPIMAATNKAFCQTGNDPKVNTAFGCVPVKIDQFVAWLLPSMFGVAGGIAFLLMCYGFFLLTTSGGDPKKVAGAQETVTSAITGLLVSIFALFLLRLLAVGILKIPGIN
ncbi:MAG: hypothetical protein WAV41_01150 [Microgenomates group bacterium]